MNDTLEKKKQRADEANAFLDSLDYPVQKAVIIATQMFLADKESDKAIEEEIKGQQETA